MLFYLAVFVVIGIIAYKKFNEAKEHERILGLLLALKNLEPDYKTAIEEFNNLDKKDWFINDREYQLWKNKYETLAEKYNPIFLEIDTEEPIKKTITDFADRFFDGRKLFIENHNEKFVQQEFPTIQNILTAKNIRYNNDQVNAIASDENNTLLVAGAGTGKTTTILGKLAYLLERAHINPEEILLLSFTGRAVDELTERIEKTFPDKKIKAQTFHSFGLSIIGEALGERPDLAFPTTNARQKFLDEQFEERLKDSNYLNLALEYFAFYFKPIVLQPGFKNLDDYYKNTKREQYLTLRKENLKSQQEVMIANFLYINGIDYEYEKPYQHKTSDKDYQQYKPDFYLPKHDIYIEHFGIDREGKTHFSENEAQNHAQTQKYLTDMEWKRELHTKNKTTLLETFSYEFTEKSWKTNLINNLQKHKVEFTPRNHEEILETVRSSGSIKEIAQLFGTFLGLAKSNGYSVEKLQDIVLSRNNPRELAFFDIFAPIYQAYEEYLIHHKQIDFDDMLIKSSRFVNDGLYKHNFKYIIIDEFQDFSVSKYMLVKALCDQNKDTKLFCVGDDWQSIFRFSGSDISLMTNFEESYGFTRKNKLVVTNRFANGLAVISNKFILKNPSQIQKEVQSLKTDQGDPVEIRYPNNQHDAELLLHEILSSINKTAVVENKKVSVFLLGRYNHNKPENFSKLVQEYKNVNLEFLTVHASKGSEADYVIILDVTSGKLGFPSQITDDPLLEIVLSKGDSYPHAEERRLMYVAMTRARQKVFIISEIGSESVFVLELEGSKKTTTEAKKCKECGGELVPRKGPYGPFLGCSNFPDCTYIFKDPMRRYRRY